MSTRVQQERIRFELTPQLSQRLKKAVGRAVTVSEELKPPREQEEEAWNWWASAAGWDAVSVAFDEICGEDAAFRAAAQRLKSVCLEGTFGEGDLEAGDSEAKLASLSVDDACVLHIVFNIPPLLSPSAPALDIAPELREALGNLRALVEHEQTLIRDTLTPGLQSAIKEASGKFMPVALAVAAPSQWMDEAWRWWSSSVAFDALAEAFKELCKDENGKKAMDRVRSVRLDGVFSDEEMKYPTGIGFGLGGRTVTTVRVSGRGVMHVYFNMPMLLDPRARTPGASVAGGALDVLGQMRAAILGEKADASANAEAKAKEKERRAREVETERAKEAERRKLEKEKEKSAADAVAVAKAEAEAEAKAAAEAEAEALAKAQAAVASEAEAEAEAEAVVAEPEPAVAPVPEPEPEPEVAPEPMPEKEKDKEDTACSRCSCSAFTPNQYVGSLCKRCKHKKGQHGPQPDLPEPEPEAETKAEPEPEAETKAEPEPEAETKAKAEPEVEVRSVEAAAAAVPPIPQVRPASPSAIQGVLRQRVIEEGSTGGRGELLRRMGFGKGGAGAAGDSGRHQSPAQLRWEAIKTAVHTSEEETALKCQRKNCQCPGFQRNKFMASLCKMCGHERAAHDHDDNEDAGPDPVQVLLDMARREAVRLRKQVAINAQESPRYWSPMRGHMDPTTRRVSTKRRQTQLKCEWCGAGASACEGFRRNRFNALVCGPCGHPRSSHEVDPDYILEENAAKAVAALRSLEDEIEAENIARVVIVQMHYKRRMAVRMLHHLQLERKYLECAVIIQSYWRRALAVRVKWRLREEKRRNMAAIRIQAVWRMHSAVLLKLRLRAQREKEAAARLLIQRVYRGHRGRTVARTLRREAAELAAASAMQRVYRGHVGRTVVRAMRRAALEEASARAMQRVYRGHAGRVAAWRARRARDEQGAALKIQSVARGRVARKHAAKLRRMRDENEAAVCMQCAWRSYTARVHVTALRLARDREAGARTIQRVYRGMVARKEATHLRHVRLAVYVQCAWRSKLARRELELLRNHDRMVRGATALQRVVRGHIARTLFHSLERAEADRRGATALQAAWRGHAARAKLGSEAEAASAEAAALTLQRVIKGHQVRKEVARIERQESELGAAVALQRVARGHITRKRVAEHREARKMAVAVMAVQMFTRALKARRELKARKERAAAEAAAVAVQRVFRGKLGRGLAAEKRREHRSEMAAASIQRAWRHVLAVRQAEAIRLAQREPAAALAMQRAWRGHRGRAAVARLREAKAESDAAVSIQRCFRGSQARGVVAGLRRADKEKKAAVHIQAVWRGRCERVSGSLPKLRWEKEEADAAVAIQRAFRGLGGRRAAIAARKLQATHKAAIAVQCAWRSRIARRDVGARRQAAAENCAAVSIQRAYRGGRGRETAAGLRAEKAREAAASAVQRAWRSAAGRKKDVFTAQARAEVEKRGKAAAILQGTWRVRGARRVAGKKRAGMRRTLAATHIQAVWRGALARQRVAGLRKAAVEARQRSATVIQRHTRRFTARRSIGDLRKHRAAVVVQSLYRGYTARKVLRMTTEGQTLMRQTQAAVRMQSIVRMYLARKLRQFLLESWAAKVIQSRWRGAAARIFSEKLADGRRRNRAAVCLQSAWRASKARDFATVVRRLQRRGAMATRIQRLFRGYRVRKRLERQRLEQEDAEHRAGALISRIGRGYLARLRFRRLNQSRSAKLATLFIQRSFRGFRARRLRTKMVTERNTGLAARVIQRKWRAVLLDRQMATHAALSRAAILIQSVLRGRLARIRVRLLQTEINSGRPVLSAFHRICDNDLKSEAVVYCRDCGDIVGYAYCGVCSTYIHMPPHMKWHRVVKLGALQQQSAIVIQTLVRAYVARCRLARLKYLRDLATGVFLAQKYTRRWLAKREAARERALQRSLFPLFCANCTDSRATIRCDECDDVYCGVCTRFLHKTAHKRKHHLIHFRELQERMAVQIQRIVRGFLARRLALHTRDDNVKVQVAVWIQALLRGKVALKRARADQARLMDAFKAEVAALASEKATGVRSALTKRLTRPRPCANCTRSAAKVFCLECGQGHPSCHSSGKYFCGLCSIQLHRHPALRKHVTEHIQRRIEWLCAVRLQSAARRMAAQRLRKELTAQARLDGAATKIQSMWRMREGRAAAAAEAERQSHLCQHCQYTFGNAANVFCVECSLRYCVACSAILHQHTHRIGHMRTPIIGAWVQGGGDVLDQVDGPLSAHLLAMEIKAVDAAAEAAQATLMPAAHQRGSGFDQESPSPSGSANGIGLGTGAGAGWEVVDRLDVDADAADIDADASQAATLDLCGMSFTVVPEDIARQGGVKILKLAHNSLTGAGLSDEVAAGLGPGLISLDLSYNRVDALPGWWDSVFTVLRSLDLSHNQLAGAGLPAWQDGLPALESLVLAGNGLVSVPLAACVMPRLQTLVLSNNMITDVAPDIARLGPSLTTLDLCENSLTALPASIGSLVSLRLLRVAHNALTELPPTMGSLTSLVEIDASSNAIQELPPALGGCVSLEKLRVSRNDLSVIPECVGQLKRLTVLEVGGNPRIQEVPLVVASLSSLRAIGLWGCDLSPAGVPDSLFDLPRLAVCDVADNVRLPIPQGVREDGLGAVKEWFRAQYLMVEAEAEAGAGAGANKGKGGVGVGDGEATKGEWVDGGGSAGRYRYLGNSWYEYENKPRNYFFNAETQVTQWDMPDVGGGVMESASKFFTGLFS